MYRCYYDDLECNHIDGATGYLDVDCEQCERYDKGIRATGALPELGIKRLIKWIKSNCITRRA